MNERDVILDGIKFHPGQAKDWGKVPRHREAKVHWQFEKRSLKEACGEGNGLRKGNQKERELENVAQ